MRVDHLEATNRRLAAGLRNMRLQSVRQHLIRRRYIFGICGLLMPLLLPLLNLVTPVTPLLGWTFGGLGVLSGVTQLWFARYIKKINIINAPTSEALRNVVKLRILERRLRYLGYMLGIPVICILFMTLYDMRPDLMVGAVAGGIVGGAIGLSAERRDIASIRRLTCMLESPDGLDPDAESPDDTDSQI